MSGTRSISDLPEATIARLPLYIRVLDELCAEAVDSVSSDDLAGRVGVTGSVLRRDLSYLGHYGTRGKGYQVDSVLQRINGALGLTDEHAVVIVGIGHLGEALATYTGFADRGLRVVGLFDADATRVGEKLGDPAGSVLEVRPVAELADCVATHRVSIAVIATPAASAQAVADELVTAGIPAILNFAPERLQVPDSVAVRQVDLAAEMQILAVHAARNAVTA